ncbi:hypothetical protein J4417_00145 [Candidatus Woesearchaeota archaeon]|nr:hypothetical protein [Candidatus Woesearchaeota archaeon]
MEKISRRGFLGTVVGGLAALAIAYTSVAPRAGVEVVEEDPLEKIVREMRETLEESDEILTGDFQTYLQKRRERLEQREDPLMKYCREKKLDCE